MNWKKFKEEKPPEGEEVLAYHPSWIDEDFNPRGIRIGFWNGGDDFKSAHWWDYQDCYNRHKQIMEVECNECTSKLFVDMIKSICNISEQVKSFINPEQIKAIAESNEPILLLSNN